MHEFVRPVAAALSVVCLAAAIAIAFAGDALAQANQAPPQNSSPLKPVKQMARDKITGQLDGVARKNGFASYDEYTNVVGNISIVLAPRPCRAKERVTSENSL